jgi:hypothetical protein
VLVLGCVWDYINLLFSSVDFKLMCTSFVWIYYKTLRAFYSRIVKSVFVWRMVLGHLHSSDALTISKM